MESQNANNIQIHEHTRNMRVRFVSVVCSFRIRRGMGHTDSIQNNCLFFDSCNSSTSAWQMTNHRLLCLYSICFQCHKSHIMMRTDDDCDHLRTQTHTNRIINYLFINRIHPRRYHLNCSTPRSWNESHCYLTSTIHFTCVTQIKWFRSTTHPEYQQRNDTYMHLHTREFSQSPVLPLLRRTFNSFAMTFALCECV